MAQESQIAHRNIRTTNLPYVSNLNPTATDPCYVPGSQNILTEVAGYSGRRPGFANTMEVAVPPTSFNNLQKIFTWDRFDGTFIEMACDINVSGVAQVFKRIVGTDNAFISIFTDTVATPFDFVVSNNQVYFSNGHVAQKWDPVNGVSLWGIAIGSVNSLSGPNGVTSGTDVPIGAGTAWSNPGNITAEDAAYATVSMTSGGSANTGAVNAGQYVSSGSGTAWSSQVCVLAPSSNSQELQATNYGFSVPTNSTINGIFVEIDRFRNASGGTVVDRDVTLLKGGAAVGNNKASGSTWPTSATIASYGSSSDVWGSSFSATDINSANFGVQLSVTNSSGGTSTANVVLIRITVYYTAPAGTQYSDYLQGITPGLSVGATSTVLGILVEVKGFQSTSNANTALYVNILKNGNIVGTNRSSLNIGASNQYNSFGGSSDLWGTTWTPTDVNGTNFGVNIQAVSSISGTVTWSIDYVRITVYFLGGPAVTTSGTGLTAQVGYQYVYCYGNSNTGHVSSPSQPSGVIIPANQGIQISLTKSLDTQVNQIRVFRSTDSVPTNTLAGIYYEIPTSPYPNSTANVVDSAADINLNINSIAPIAGFNDRPNNGIGFRGMEYYAGRVWGFINNTVYFSSSEECVNGVPEESFVSGPAGNFWTFDQPVQGLAVAGTLTNQALLIFSGGRIYGITGNSLDTFRRFLISNRRGCRNYNTVTSLGGMVAWLDSANQVWGTDGSSLQEISVPIRPDLIGINPASCSMTFHTSGKFHWLVLSTGSKLFVFDMDMNQWMPPWTVSAKYIYSGETSAGNYDLCLSTGIYALTLSTTAHNDFGSPYTPIWRTNLYSAIPDYGSRFAYQSQGMYDEPSRTGWPTIVEVDTNSIQLSDVGLAFDDDPTTTTVTYGSIFANKQGPDIAYNRQQGVNIVQNAFPLVGDQAQSCRWVSMQFKGANADDALRIYSFFLGYKPTGGR